MTDRCRPRHRHPHRHRRRLFWRIYLYGLVLLIAVVCAVAAANKLMWSGTPWGGERAAHYLVARLEPLVDRPAELERELAALHEAFHADIAVYREDGRIEASAGTPPPPLDERPEKLRIQRQRGGNQVSLPLGRSGRYFVAHAEAPGPGPAFVVSLLVVLVVLALLSLPFARGMARPLERLSATARALGEGDLAARTGLAGQDEIAAVGRAFDEMAGRLERMVAAERELLANVSHELRTPLARIRVALELADEQDDPEAWRRHLRGIGGDLAELEQLVDEVLAAARLDHALGRRGPDAEEQRGRDTAPMSLSKAAIDVAQLFEETTTRFTQRHAERALQVTVLGEPTLVGDASLLRRLLLNLLDNAAKYADAERDPIELAASVEGDSCQLEVRDRGIGVDAADVDSLFEPFFRTPRGRERFAGGVGLGLSLCRSIAEAHGGRIEAERREGGGIVVRVVLPLA